MYVRMYKQVLCCASVMQLYILWFLCIAVTMLFAYMRIYCRHTYSILDTYIHVISLVSLLLPAQLCTSHKEELADLNKRLSAQEEEICQKAQVVRTLQVHSYIYKYTCIHMHYNHAQHLTATRPLKPTLTVSMYVHVSM